MIFNKKGTTIVEALVVVLIITVGVVGVFSIYINSQNLAGTTANRIKAIGIAREGVEVMMNIRDTNRIIFSPNKKDCWNTLNYNAICQTATSTGNPQQPSTYSIWSGSYIIYNDTQNNNPRWFLQTGNSLNSNYINKDYQNTFKIMEDANGLYIQSGGTNTGNMGSGLTDTKPLFTREIIVAYSGVVSDLVGSGVHQNMDIKSLVQWGENTSTKPIKVNLDLFLTNWKK